MLEALPLEIYKLTHSEHLMQYTANVYRDLQGVYREIRVPGFQIYGDCPLPKIHVILKFPHSHFHCNNCGGFYFTGIFWEYPTLVVGKSCMYQLWGNHVIMKYEIKLYREMHVSFTSKTHVDVMFVGI